MKKEIKQTVQPQLRKKNGVWIKVLVPALCIVAGAGAMAGLVYGVPAVNNAFITNKDGTTTKPSGEVLDLKNQISELTTKLQNATTLADERGNKIAELNSQIEQIKADSALSDEQKQEQINSLTAQLNQAVVDKEQAESLVAGLQAQIEELQAKIDQMEGNAIVDTLQLENFVGTWYKNGTFEDYFTIEGTTITRGANVDKGVIYKLYNQVYLGLNSMDNTACELSENGTKITLADGTVYTKSFINTLENAPINMAFIAGTYSFEEELITLNSDNTASYFDGSNTYYGAFTATATEKNVGGNITLTQEITLTLNNEEQETLKFKIINNSEKFLIDNKTFIKLHNEENLLTLGSKNINTNYIFRFKVDMPDTINNLTVLLSAKTDTSTQLGSLTAGFNVGGKTVSMVTSSGLYNVNLAITPGNYDYIDLAVTISPSYDQYNFYMQDLKIIGNEINAELIDVIKCREDDRDNLKLGEQLNKFLIKTNYVQCNAIPDYFTGTWSSDSLSVNLTSELATITPADGELITATEYTVTAKTDGTNIIHTVTVKYTDASEVEHTLTFDITNNATTTTTALLDEEELILNKA